MLPQIETVKGFSKQLLDMHLGLTVKQALCHRVATQGQGGQIASDFYLGAAQDALDQHQASEPYLVRNKSLPYLNNCLFLSTIPETMLDFIGDTNTQSPYL